MERQELDELTREQLIALAIQLGIPKPRSLTMPELVDEILARTVKSTEDRARFRGFLGRARDLLAGVVERGLHLPEVTRSLRRPEPSPKAWPKAPPPLATVTLAELYAGQGHFDKALTVLDEILTREPEHSEAQALRQQIAAKMDQSGDAAAEETSMASEAETNAEEAAIEPTESAETNEAAPQPEAPAEAAAPADVTTAPAIVEASAEPALPPIAEPAVEPAVEPVEAAVEPSADVTNPIGIWPAPSADAMAELPLPERYNVDEIVAIAVDPTTLYLYWEVRPTTFAHARASRPEGALVVRTVHVTPSWDGPVTEQRDLQTDALYGDAYVHALQPGSNVRVAVGWLSHGIFEPFAIGAEVTTSRTEPTASTAKKLGRWSAEALGRGQGAEDSSARWTAPPHAAVLEAFWGGSNVAVSVEGARALATERVGDRLARAEGRGAEEKPASMNPGGQTRGGSSEIPRGGSSALVRPGTR